MSKEFVLDLASYQSGMTVAQIKQTGATTAIIKLTESTNYINPYIDQLISRCKEAGINKFGFYHFQRATTVEGMRAEANYFVNVAKKYAGNSTMLFLDAELKNAVPNTQAIKTFYDVVRQNGYRVGFYTYKFMYSYFDKSVFTDADTVWAAAYPLGNKATSEAPNFNYFPSQDNVGLWQFTDNWCGLNVDCSYTLTDGIFEASSSSNNNNHTASTSTREWYTTVLKQITLKQDTALYKDEALNEYVDTFKKGEVFNIVGEPHIDSHGHVSYQTESGLFVTGDKAYIDSNYWLLASYGGKKAVRLKSKQGLYKDLGFKELEREYEKGTVFNIVANEKSKSGYPRLKTESGFYITANKKYVEWV